MKNTFCPECFSYRVGRFKLPYNFHGGDWTPANKLDPESDIYDDYDVDSFKDNRHPDIDCFLCIDCDTYFKKVEIK